MIDKTTEKAFKQVNHAVADWENYNKTAIALSALRGERVSIPALLREAYTKYVKDL